MGEITLLVWCAWRLDSPDAVLTGSTDEESKTVNALNDLVGSVISDVKVLLPGWDLRVMFSNGTVLSVFADQFRAHGFNGNWEIWERERGISVKPGGIVTIEETDPCWD